MRWLPLVLLIVLPGCAAVAGVFGFVPDETLEAAKAAADVAALATAGTPWGWAFGGVAAGAGALLAFRKKQPPQE